MSVEIMKLLDVCDFQGGTQPPKEEWVDNPQEGYVRMLQIRDYSQGDEKFIQYVKDNGKLHKCESDDIMLSRYGYIGQAFMGLSGAYNVALVKVIKRREVNTRYLYHYFRSYYFQHFLLSNVGARATIPGFNKSELSNALIPMPNANEQEKIASILDKIDVLRNKVEKQYVFFDKLVKSQFIEMFGGYDLSHAQDTWERIGAVADVIGGSTPKTEKAEFWGGEHFWITPAEINDDSYVISSTVRTLTEAGVKSCSLKLLPKGTVLLSSRAPIGKVAIAGVNMYCNQGFKNLICGRRLNPIYTYCLLKFNSSYLNSLGRGATFKEMSKAIVDNIAIPVPPIERQNEFACFVEQTDKSKVLFLAHAILMKLLLFSRKNEKNMLYLSCINLFDHREAII